MTLIHVVYSVIVNRSFSGILTIISHLSDVLKLSYTHVWSEVF